MNKKNTKIKYIISLVCLIFVSIATFIASNHNLLPNIAIFIILSLCSIYLTKLSLDEWIKYMVWTTILFSIYLFKDVIGAYYEIICIVFLLLSLMINIKLWRYYAIISTQTIIFLIGSLHFAIPFAICGMSIVNIFGPKLMDYLKKYPKSN